MNEGLINKMLSLLLATIILSGCMRQNIYMPDMDSSVATSDVTIEHQILIDYKAAKSDVTQPTIIDHPYMQDLIFLTNILDENHPGFDKAAFELEINEISSKMSKLDDISFYFEVRRLLAQLGDSHTYANIKLAEEDRRLPILQIEKFDNKRYIAGIQKTYAEHLGKEIIAINSVPIDDIISFAKPYISYENEINLEFVFLNEIRNPAFLKYLGIINDIEIIPITLKPTNGEAYDIKIKTFLASDSEQYAGVWISSPITGQYKSQRNYRFEPLNNDILFIQYNKCDEDASNPINDFQRLLVSELQSGNYKKVVFDLRYNNGGMFSLFKPVTDELGRQKQKLGFELYCLIGNTTFSTGVMHAVQLKDFGATLVGRPTRGKPNFYANTKEILLPNSGIGVYYSTGYMETMPDYEGQSLNPDIYITNNYTQFVNGIDCDVDAVKKE